MAQLISKAIRTVIDEQWHTRPITYDHASEIGLWCFEHMGYPVGQLDPRTFDYNYRWHIEVPVRSSLVTHTPFVSFKDEKDLSMYLLRWGTINE